MKSSGKRFSTARRPERDDHPGREMRLGRVKGVNVVFLEQPDRIFCRLSGRTFNKHPVFDCFSRHS